MQLILGLKRQFQFIAGWKLGTEDITKLVCKQSSRVHNQNSSSLGKLIDNVRHLIKA